MPNEFQIDPERLLTALSSLGSTGDDFQSAMSQWRSTLQQHDGCWGDDEMGKKFGENFVKAEQQADQLADPSKQWFGYANEGLRQAQNHFLETDGENARRARSAYQDPGDC